MRDLYFYRRWWVIGSVALLPAVCSIAQPEVVEAEGDAPLRLDPVEADAEQGEDDAGAGGLGFARRVERAAQRATARELERELSGLIGPDGLPIALGPGPVREALRDVATRCELLAHGTGEPIALEVLYASEARVYNALVQDAAAHGEPVDVARGLAQLRDAARRLGDLDTPSAATAGAYWQMLADLIDANRTIDNAADRRVLVREMVSRFVEEYGDVPGQDGPDSEYVLDARVALARLMDEAGQQQAAIEALGPLTDLSEDDPRYEQVQAVVAHHALLGREVELELPASDGGAWRLSDHAGKPVLVHVFAQGVGDSGESVPALRRGIAEARLGGYAVVSLHVGTLIPGRALPPWPTALVEPGRRGVLDALGVDAVPMYVWLDHAGRVAAIGRTLDVVRQIPAPPPAGDASSETGDGAVPDADPAVAPDAAPAE